MFKEEGKIMKKLWLKNYHSKVPHELPPLDKNLVELFEMASENFKNQTAFISFGKHQSYKELREKALNLAGFLQSQGLKKGDVIALQLPNLLQYPVSLWASILSGLTVVNLNPLYSAREMLTPLKETKAKAIIIFSGSLPALSEIIDQTELKTVIVTNPGDLLDFPKKQILNTAFKFQSKTKKIKKTYSSFLKALREGSKTPPRIQKRGMEETFFIQYTGGTTGISKGVCLSQKNILSNCYQCELWMLTDLKKGKERALAALPLYHIFAFVLNGLVFFLNGFSNLLIANPRQIPSLVKNLKKHPITVGTGVNTLFKALLKSPEFQKLDFSSWKLFVAGGMALDSSVQKDWEILTQSSLIEGYGLTEASPVVSCNRLDQSIEKTVGLPFPSTEIRVMGPGGKELRPNEEGELEVRGPQVMKGYFQKEEETKKVLSPEGWLKTGDIVKVSEEGLIQIIDRQKDMINVSGLKVYPNEVEEVLLSSPKVKETVVVPSKDEEGAEIIKAFIVKNTDHLTTKELTNHCKKNLAPYKIPRELEFVKEIPKNSVGKPLRKFFKQQPVSPTK